MNDEEFRDLQERVSLIQSMTENPGWIALRDRALVTMLKKQTFIIQGKCASYEDYVKECSFTDGMEFILRLPDRVRMELELELGERFPPEQEEEDEEL